MFLGGLVYLAAISPVFKIKEIAVSGNKILETGQIQAVVQNYLSAKIFKIIPQDRLLILASGNLKNKILANFPEIESVQIIKIPPAKLELTIKERKTAAVWCQTKIIPSPTPETSKPAVSAPTSSPVIKEKNVLPESEKCFFMDEGGIIYREAPEMSGSFLPIFYNQSSQVYNLKDQVSASSTIGFALLAKKELRQAEIDLIGFLIKEKGSPDLVALTDEGWLIYFDSSRSAVRQINVLESLLNEEIKEKRENLEYVDLRIANRVYYK